MKFKIILKKRVAYYVFADKDRELADANAEIKSLRNSERLKEKAVEEVNCCLYFPKMCVNFRSLNLGDTGDMF